jgi:hypothetical protein
MADTSLTPLQLAYRAGVKRAFQCYFVALAEDVVEIHEANDLDALRVASQPLRRYLYDCERLGPVMAMARSLEQAQVEAPAEQKATEVLLVIPPHRRLYFCGIYRRPDESRLDYPTTYGCSIPVDLLPDDDSFRGLKVRTEWSHGSLLDEPVVRATSRMAPLVRAHSDGPLTKDGEADLLRLQLDRLDAMNQCRDDLFKKGRQRLLTVEPYVYPEGRGLALKSVSIYLKKED